MISHYHLGCEIGLDLLKPCVMRALRRMVPDIHTHTTILRPFSGTTRVSRCLKRTSGLWCKGRLTEADPDHPAGRHSIHTNQCPPPPSTYFYRPDALPAAQPTVKALKALKDGSRQVVDSGRPESLIMTHWWTGSYDVAKELKTSGAVCMTRS